MWQYENEENYLFQLSHFVQQAIPKLVASKINIMFLMVLLFGYF